MTASTMPHASTRHAAHATGRPGSAGRSATAGRPGPDARPDVRHAAHAQFECEDGCHYCQGPETD